MPTDSMSNGNSVVWASGLTNKEYCIPHALSEKSFYYWQKKLRAQIVDAIPELVPIKGPLAWPGELRIRCQKKIAGSHDGWCHRKNQQGSCWVPVLQQAVCGGAQVRRI